MKNAQRKLTSFLLLIAACGSALASGATVSENGLCYPPHLPGVLDVEVEGISLSNPPPNLTVPIQIYFSAVQVGDQFMVQVDAAGVPVGVYSVSIVWNYSIVGGGASGPFVPVEKELLESGTLTVTKDANGNFHGVLEWHENPGAGVLV